MYEVLLKEVPVWWIVCLVVGSAYVPVVFPLIVENVCGHF